MKKTVEGNYTEYEILWLKADWGRGPRSFYFGWPVPRWIFISWRKEYNLDFDNFHGKLEVSFFRKLTIGWRWTTKRGVRPPGGYDFETR